MQSKTIHNIISKGKPAAIGKIGFSEMRVLHASMTNIGDLTQQDLHDIFVVAGVFPPTENSLITFVQEMQDILLEVDVLAKMRLNSDKEDSVIDKFAKDSDILELRDLEPYYWESPWSAKLKDKKVLIISPFTDTIAKQYSNKDKLWDRCILPDMELKHITCPPSNYLRDSRSSSWKETLDRMKEEMKQIDFDVCLIGAGAWSLPLAVEAKRLGKIGIHLGGPLQILFGIKGRRWDAHDVISKMYNEHWVRPSKSETPENNFAVEGGCYW